QMIVDELARAFLVALVADTFARRDRFPRTRELFSAAILYNIGATFLFYTIALEHQKGSIQKVDHDAVRTMAPNRARDLNRLVSEGLRLPREVDLVYGFGRDDVEGPQENSIVRYIHQGMWAADRVLSGDETLRLDVEAEIVGLDERAVAHLNVEMVRIREL